MFVESSQEAPSLGSTGADDLGHIAAHLVIFAALAFCLARAFASSPRAAVIGVVLTGLYGLSDELHQSFVPTRSAQVSDLVFDVIGAVTGSLASYWLSRRSSSTALPRQVK